MNERHIVLTRATYYQIIHELWRSLPPPVSDRPEDLVLRDNAAMAEVASLLPADPAEAALACKFVAASAYAMDCLRLSKEHRADLNVSMKCMAQAASMMRQSCCARSSLLRIQEARRKREAPGIGSDEPAWSDHGILDRMGEALTRAQADAPKAGPAGSANPGTTEQAGRMRDTHSPAALVRAGEPAGDALAVENVSCNETDSQNNANETPARLVRSPCRIDDTPDRLPGPHARSRPPHRPNDRPEAPSGRAPASFAPSRPPLPTSDAITDALNRAPHPTGTMPAARAA